MLECEEMKQSGKEWKRITWSGKDQKEQNKVENNGMEQNKNQIIEIKM